MSAYWVADYYVYEPTDLTVLASGVSGSALTVVAVTTVFRKFIGLEIATLYQAGYLTMLHIDKPSEYTEPVSKWNTVFGYNGLTFYDRPSSSNGSRLLASNYRNY